MLGAAESAESVVLPVLRHDLCLASAAPDSDGSPMWTLFDPLCSRYYHLHIQGLRLIRRWRAGATAEALAGDLSNDGVPVTGEEVAGMVNFMVASNLTQSSTPADTARLAHQANHGKTAWYQWVMHRYLFFRVPLVQPDSFLVHWLPWARKLVSKPALWTLVAIGGLGLFLAGRQWDELTSTFLRFLSWEGILWYALALMFTKSAHELGHAFVAKHFGCRVPTMGIAFLVMVPMLYTDATDTWRLLKDVDRLRVSAAGVATELAVAVVATFVWAVLPDSGLRQAAFFLATISWVATVLINLSPFMRFDGYHVLTDIWGIRNLQPRSFALTLWRIREALFGFDEAPPEAFSRRRQRLLMLYAVGCWTYRLFLFLGIALLVYHFVFKALGIVLFCVEIGFFIVRPVAKEMRAILSRRWRLNKQSIRTAIGFLIVLGLFFIPWHGTLGLPAVRVAADQSVIHAPEPARIKRVAVSAGDRVAKGQTLFVLENPDIAAQLAEEKKRLSVVRTRLARRAGSATDLADSGVLREQMARISTKIAGLKQRRAALVIKSRFAGRVVERAHLRGGQWVSRRESLAQIVAEHGTRVYAYVRGQNLARLEDGATARFIPNDGAHRSVDLKLRDIDDAGDNHLAYPLLASIYGGSLPVTRDKGARQQAKDHRLVLNDGVYRVTLIPTKAQLAPDWPVRGKADVQGRAESIAGSTFRYAASVFIRESSF